MNTVQVITEIAEAQKTHSAAYDSLEDRFSDIFVKINTGEIEESEFDRLNSEIKAETTAIILDLVGRLISLWNTFYELTGYTPKAFYYNEGDGQGESVLPIQFDLEEYDHNWPSPLHNFIIEQVRYSDPYEAEIEYELSLVVNS